MTSTGRVSAFDDQKGYGTIVDDAAGDELFFHCTALTDGTRTVAVGATVTFDVAPGHHGRLEARRVVKVD